MNNKNTTTTNGEKKEQTSNKITQGLIIGRFQLVGNHHVDFFDQIIKYNNEIEKIDELVVCIGIDDKVNSKNPFSGTECLNMIKPIAQNAAKKMNVPVVYKLIPDINNPKKYASYITEQLDNKEKNKILFSTNNYTLTCFENKENYKIKKLDERINEHATHLRKMCADGKDLSSLVPIHVNKYITENNIGARLQKLMYNNPIAVVDIIIEYQDGIVLIERNEIPYGIVFPGGHVDMGESCVNAAIREAKEETNLDVKIKYLIGEFSGANRDPRPGQRVSLAYAAIGNGTLKASSDAKTAKVYTLEEVANMKLGFDHNDIFDKYQKIRAYEKDHPEILELMNSRKL